MGWTAQIIVSDGGSGFKHLYATIDGDSHAEAIEGAQSIYEGFGSNRECFIRVLPEAHSETDFDTKITRHRGFVRFSFGPNDGPHHMPSENSFIGFEKVA